MSTKYSGFNSIIGVQIIANYELLWCPVYGNETILTVIYNV